MFPLVRWICFSTGAFQGLEGAYLDIQTDGVSAVPVRGEAVGGEIERTSIQ
jgi:hypothetical protein